MSSPFRKLASALDKLRQVSFVKRSGSNLDSSKLFLYWSLRSSGESDIESMIDVSEVISGSGPVPSTEALRVASGLLPQRSIAHYPSSASHDSYELFETTFQSQGGIRERMGLLESNSRKVLRVETSTLETRLIVLTFVLFMVPFAFLLSSSYLFHESSPVVAIFFIVHPLVSYLVARWATMDDGTLAF